MTPSDAEPTQAGAAERFESVAAALTDRWPEDVLEPSLDRVRRAVELLGDPQEAYPVIQVAGTNGKTSTARMIDALLAAFGIRAGRYTSPHLDTVRERICIAGEPISAERFVDTYDDVIPYVEMVDAASIADGGPAMSTFEVLTVLALAAFADAPVDAAVLEVGMGGTWDATNVVDAVVAVVTPIGLDHAQYLGGTIPLVAAEKAGIIKPGSRAVLAPQLDEAAEVLDARVRDTGAEGVRGGVDFGVVERRVAVGGQLLTLRGLAGDYDEVYLPLHGEHQAGNAALALAAVESFLGGGERPLDLETVRAGFAAVTSPGRLELVRRSPAVLVDAAHNPAGAEALAAAVVDAFSFGRLVAVVGTAADKDVEGIVAALSGVVDVVVATAAASPRALPAASVGRAASAVLGEDRVVVIDELPEALEHAVQLADDDGPGGSAVLVVGSVVLAAQARLLLGTDAPESAS